MKYRKTALIEAQQYVGGSRGLSPDFAAALCWKGRPDCDTYYVPHIHTLEGNHDVRLYDWIARGIKGEFWPIKPDIFAATYEPAEPQDGEGGTQATEVAFTKPRAGKSGQHAPTSPPASPKHREVDGYFGPPAPTSPPAEPTSGYAMTVKAPMCQFCRRKGARLPRIGDPLGLLCEDCVPAPTPAEGGEGV